LNHRFALAANCLDKLARFFPNFPDMKTHIPPVLITFALVCFTLLPKAQAVSPAPDGGYPGGNTAEGQNALFSRTTGGFNTAVGFLSLRSDTTNSFNTAIGAGTLLANTADENTATGAGALLSNTTGFANTANGAFALFSNTQGTDNTAIGQQALFSNTTGNANTGNGAGALGSNTAGNGNTANGVGALLSNTTGDGNTANGYQALFSNATGTLNTANGAAALGSNTTGGNNTADGYQSLYNNTTGSFNVALAGGFNLTTGNFNIDIGNDGVAGEATTIRIGSGCCQTSTFIAGIRDATTGNADAIPVLIDSVGQLGTASSSRRFKKEIKPMDKASDAVLALKPVTFHYKSDATSTAQFGLIAEEVAAVNPDLVVRDKDGEIYTVRYDAVNAMLLNEFLKAHRKMEQQEATIAQLKSVVTKQEAIATEQQQEIADLTTSLKEQAAQIQKVSARLEASKPSPQVVNNP
jgi:hypothetical protein